MLFRLALVLLCSTLAFPQVTKKTPPDTVKKAGRGQKPTAHPTAILHTTAGDMRCELFPDQAPKAVSNFIGLATGTKDWTNPATGQKVHGKALYDGVIFHRVIPEFMIQGGDPLGTGTGNPGYQFEDELHADLLFDRPGRLAMANSGPNTNGSQFFITEKETPFLNPCLEPNGCMGGRRAPNSGYTIFGQCDDKTVELVKKIARMPCSMGPCNSTNSHPADPIKINHIEISGAGAAKTPAPKSGTTKKPATKK